VATLGVDEHAWVHASTGYATGIVDSTPHRPARLTVVPGRTGKVYADREAAWRQQIRVAALDPFRGYATALPDATRRLDAFHLVALANKMVDEVRQRIQQKTLGHRGRNGDPLYEIRRLLRPSIKTLPNRTRRNIDIALQVGDRPTPSPSPKPPPSSCPSSATPHPRGRRQQTLTALTSLPDCLVPKVARLGRTLRVWRTELLGYFDTGGASGPTEAMNLLIKKRRRAAHGFRNSHHYRLRLLLAHGLPRQDQPTAQTRTRHPRFTA
jgi:transposase